MEAIVFYLRYTVLMSSKKDDTAVHCCDLASSVLVMFLSRFARASSEKVLIKLINSTSGQECNINEFLTRSKVLVDTVIDMCSIVDRFEKCKFSC